MRRKNKGSGKCVFAAALLILGSVCLCLVSYRFLLFIIGALLIIAGVVTIRKC